MVTVRAWPCVTYHFSLYIYIFLNLFLAALGLRCCVWAFSSCGERGLSCFAACGIFLDQGLNPWFKKKLYNEAVFYFYIKHFFLLSTCSFAKNHFPSLKTHSIVFIQENSLSYFYTLWLWILQENSLSYSYTLRLWVLFHQVCCCFFFLAGLCLRCYAWAFSSCGEQGLRFVAVLGLLIVVASLVVEHRL